MDPVDRVRVRAVEGDRELERDDLLAVEEPLLIRVRTEGGRAFPFVTTMRTPGNDEELVAGLLFAEGVVEVRQDILRFERPNQPGIGPEQKANALIATLSSAAVERAEKLHRGSVMGSACGVCGKTSIDNVIPVHRSPLASTIRLTSEVLLALPERLRARQSLFAATGGLHAAGLFSPEGVLREVREDIGRHNATDKLIGTFLLRDEVPLSETILVVSGRAGFEIVQKAFAAGIPIVASVSAPSSLAVALADAGGVTLVGFLRDRRFNVYSNRGRVSHPNSDALIEN